MRLPHLGERDPEKWPKNALKGIVQGTFSAILEVHVLSDAGESVSDIGTSFEYDATRKMVRTSVQVDGFGPSLRFGANCVLPLTRRRKVDDHL